MSEGKTKSGWNAIPEAPVTSLSDVLSEQLVESILEQDSTITRDDQESVSPEVELPADSGCQLANDRKIAETLQYEYNLEHDQFLRDREKIINGHQKVRTSLKNFLLLCPDQTCVDDVARHAVEPEDNDPVTPTRDVYRDSRGNYISKHDAVTCGRRNACRAMQLPDELDVGDLIGQQLSNVAYNSLKSWSKVERQRTYRRQDKSQQAVSQIVLDPKTAVLLLNFVDKGIIDEIGACLANGKEATVFYASGGYCQNKDIPKHCAIKVFHTTINEFKTRSKYIKDDYRFENRFKSLNTRKVVRMWAEKEFHNLNRMCKAGINCPKPALIKSNILIMDLIGQDGQAAPTLQDARLDCAGDMEDAAEQCIQILKRLFLECSLVHADLSEYNLLWHDNKVWVLDVAQAITVSNPDALEYLYRDCFNVSKFFRKNGHDAMLSADELFHEITGFWHDTNDSEYVSKVDNCCKSQRTTTSYLKSTENWVD